MRNVHGVWYCFGAAFVIACVVVVAMWPWLLPAVLPVASAVTVVATDKAFGD